MPPKKTRLREKIKYAHLTIKGHTFTSPYSPDDLELHFECRETGDTNDTPHTHVGYWFRERHTAADIVKLCSERNELPRQNFHITSAPHFSTIIGYHLGLGGKPRCS